MPLYRVKVHEVCGVPAGGTLELTEREAAGFLDKLELVAAQAAAEPPPSEPAPEPVEDVSITKRHKGQRAPKGS